MSPNDAPELFDDEDTTLTKIKIMDGDLDMPNMDEDDEYRAPDLDRLIDG